jgi:hypothetical protein
MNYIICIVVFGIIFYKVYNKPTIVEQPKTPQPPLESQKHEIPTSSEFNDSVYFNHLMIESPSYDTTIVL